MTVGLSGVRVVRSGRTIIEVPQLEFPSGTVTAVLGPNGAGKTTLLRVVAGLEKPAAGDVVRSGGTAADLAYVFQEDVFLRRPVRANLEIGLRLRGIEAGERRRRIEDAAARLHIDHLLDRPATALSGGEGRRVSIARALALGAPLLLLDEPLAGLDEQTYWRLLQDLPPLLVRPGVTTLFVTHDRHEALRLADRIVVLIEGRVHAAGTKHDVMTRPSSAAVARVLGYLVLSADGRRVAADPEGLVPGPGDVSFTLTVAHVADLVEYREVTGYVGDTPVRIRLDGAHRVADVGSRMTVRATRFRLLPD